MASDESGISVEKFAKADEKLKGSYLINALRKIPYSQIVEPSDKDFTSDINLFNIQSEIIRELARTESCIIIGKCADYVLKDFDNVISVYVEAPKAACVKSIMAKMHVTEKEAHRLITKTDKYRADYYKYYTQGGYWTNPVNYDMTLNTDRVGRDKCVQLIKEYIKIKFGNIEL